MLGTLIKKEFMEIFRSYFYDARKNKTRKRWMTILWFILFAGVILGLLGGVFTVIAIGLYFLLKGSDNMWMFYSILGILSLAIGVFGSVISTYTRLYKARDNELLLAMPIPVHTILCARLLTASILNMLYSGIVFLPGYVFRLVMDGFCVSVFIGGLIQFMQILLLGLILTCLVSWFAAKVSSILKYKALVRATLLLIAFGIYMFCCINISNFMDTFVVRVFFYGQKIREIFYPLYVWGCVGDGWRQPILVSTALVLAAFLISYRILAGSFLKLVTSSDVLSRAKVNERKTIRPRSLSQALLAKEFQRFTDSANYMLNCGLGVLGLVLMGIVALVRGKYILMLLPMMMGERKAILPILAALVICAGSAMNDMAVPSVSLEGSSLWILKTLPVPTWEILKAKMKLQLILTLIPTLFACFCVRCVMRMETAETIFFFLVPLGYGILMTLLDLLLGIWRANLTWKNEIVPIKQSFAVLLGLIGGMVLILVPGALILIWGYRMQVWVLFGLLFLTEGIVILLLYRCMRTKGVEAFERLL